ncbi:MAG: ABC transporter substrate-binding protein, partial [Akkermansiaceae bacterium]|nr:ABC transporter substrate-binding protein [Armatimonadota bacterium]
MSIIRIASLVPFATEIVCALGLEENLVAVSHVCDYPASVKTLPVVTSQTVLPTPQILTDEDGDPYEVPPSAKEIDDAVRAAVASDDGLYRIDTAKLLELKPDLILTQGLCDVCAASHVATAKAVSELGDAVKILDLSPTTLSDVLIAIRSVGVATGREAEAEEVISDMTARFEAVQLHSSMSPNRPRTLLLEWPEPLFCAGHWSPELLTLIHATPA